MFPRMEIFRFFFQKILKRAWVTSHILLLNCVIGLICADHWLRKSSRGQTKSWPVSSLHIYPFHWSEPPSSHCCLKPPSTPEQSISLIFFFFFGGGCCFFPLTRLLCFCSSLIELLHFWFWNLFIRIHVEDKMDQTSIVPLAIPKISSEVWGNSAGILMKYIDQTIPLHYKSCIITFLTM